MLLSDNILADVYKSRAVIVFISHEQLFIAKKSSSGIGNFETIVMLFFLAFPSGFAFHLCPPLPPNSYSQLA